MENIIEVSNLNEKIKEMQKELVDLSEVVFYLMMGFSSVSDGEYNEITGCLSVLYAELNRISSDKIAELQEASADVEKYCRRPAEP